MNEYSHSSSYLNLAAMKCAFEYAKDLMALSFTPDAW
jgi:hypothetical protein